MGPSLRSTGPACSLVVVVLLGLGAPLSADPGAPPSLMIETGRSPAAPFTLAGPDACRQLLVSGYDADGQVRDLTRAARYRAEPEGIVAVDPTGLVMPRKEGKAVIRAEAAGLVASTTVTVTDLASDLPVNFPNQVVPVFTKLGCNAGGCHGKASGQNGFRLSLLGFEPAEDHEFLTREARGRRLFFAAPPHSLLLRKAAGAMGHGGGKRVDPESPFYRLLLRWIEQGAPYTQPGDPVVERIEVLPGARLLERGGQQQLVVLAHRSDGSSVDITRMARLESNQPEMAEVSDTGLVTTKSLPGSVAIMARYQAHVAVFRATVPLGAAVTQLPPASNFIDELVFKRLQQLGLPPSPLCDDATFLRRVTIDIAGRLPTLEETQQFLVDSDAQKNQKLVDRLLASGDYADHFANKWSAVLRNRRKSEKDDPRPTAAFHAWIRDRLHENTPYDQFVRAILTAAGEEVKVPPVVWYREVADASAQLEDMAQLFLGQRLGCARCHHHPFEKWSQQDYYGLAAFFTRLDVKDPPAPKVKKGEPPAPKPPLQVSLKPVANPTLHPRTGAPIPPTVLGGKVASIDAETDPRQKLVDWMVAPENPFFARALANRYWKHFLAKGLVEPEDDMRVTNPASNPELLDALAAHFVRHQYDVKDLVHTICTSQVYRLSAEPNASNGDDRQNSSRYLPKRLNAEVLLDAVDAVTGAKTQFTGLPAGTRAVQLPDNQFESYFLSVFGRPESSSACECERTSDASLAQCLYLFNSTELLEKIAGPGKGDGATRAARLARDKRSAEEKIRELYLVALSRQPRREELTDLLAYLDKHGSDQAAYEDVVWALLNSKEFLFNH